MEESGQNRVPEEKKKEINKREGERNMRKERENGGFTKHWHRRGEARWQHGASLASTE